MQHELQCWSLISIPKEINHWNIGNLSVLLLPLLSLLLSLSFIIDIILLAARQRTPWASTLITLRHYQQLLRASTVRILFFSGSLGVVCKNRSAFSSTIKVVWLSLETCSAAYSQFSETCVRCWWMVWTASLFCVRVLDGDPFFYRGRSGVVYHDSERGVPVLLAPSKL